MSHGHVLAHEPNYPYAQAISPHLQKSHLQIATACEDDDDCDNPVEDAVEKEVNSPKRRRAELIGEMNPIFEKAQKVVKDYLDNTGNELDISGEEILDLNDYYSLVGIPCGTLCKHACLIVGY